MAPTEIAEVKTQEIEQRTSATVEKAAAIIITDQEDLDAATAFLREVKRVRDEIAETFDPIVSAAHEAHKLALEKKKKYDEPMAQAEKVVKAKMGEYVADQKRIADELQRKQEEDRRKAEAEATRKQAEEAEAQRKRDEEARLAQAAEATARGDTKRAEAILNEPPPPPPPLQPVAVPPPVAIAIPKVAGVSFAPAWKARVVDKQALIRAAANSPEQYAAYLLVDEKAAGALARSLKGEARLPGVEFYSETQTSVRR